MKKTDKRLNVTRQTLRVLTTKELDKAVVGGLEDSSTVLTFVKKNDAILGH